MIWQIRSTDSADTERLGEALGKQLKGGEVIELRSDLGGGKTTFVRGLARGVGARETVSSPTFTIMNRYKASPAGSARKQAGAMRNLWIHHFDFYRLSEPGIIADQLAESLAEQNVVTVVEWGNTVEDVLPSDRLVIRLSPFPDNSDERKIEITYPDSFAELVRKWQAGAAGVKP